MPREKRASGAPKVAMTSHDLSVKTAWLYYVEGFTQEQIAQKLDVSRVKVMRTLANCTADGIVVTTINMETTEQVALERALEKRWNLDAAVVVPTPAGEDHLEKAIGHAIALYLGQEMRDGMTLAIGGGATLHASLGFLTRRPLKRASVVALVEACPIRGRIDPSIVAAKVADVFEVDSYQIPAPVMVSNSSLRDLLWGQSTLQDVRNRAARADIALLTVGGHVSSRDDLPARHRPAVSHSLSGRKGRSRKYALLFCWSGRSLGSTTRSTDGLWRLIFKWWVRSLMLSWPQAVNRRFRLFSPRSKRSTSTC